MTCACGSGPPATEEPPGPPSPPQLTAWARYRATSEALETVDALPYIVCFDCVPSGDCWSGYAKECYYLDLFRIAFQCQSLAECDPSSIPPEEEECVPGNMTAGGGLGSTTFDKCEGYEWAYYLWVRALIPPHVVQVGPFPRWFVGMGAPLGGRFESGSPGTLVLNSVPVLSTSPDVCQPQYDGEGCWSEKACNPDWLCDGSRSWDEDDLAVGYINKYRIGLRWRRVDQMSSGQDPGRVPSICWSFGDRAWNIGRDFGYGPVSNTACGSTVHHIYETSSYGLPANGPGFIPADEVCPPGKDHCCEQIPGVWDNPAYQVTVPTYWAVEWARDFERWEQVPGCAEDTCGCKTCENPLGCSSKCDCTKGGTECTGDNEFCDCDPRYDWVRYWEPWNVIDLRQYDEGTWYRTSWAVVTTARYEGCNYEYRDPSPGTAVRVPVIEVQSVLRDPCVLDNSCPP